MAAQPANASISVFMRLRAVKANGRHTSIKHLTTPFDGYYVPAPGEEIQVVETRDTTFRTDSFRFGHPVVVHPRANCGLAAVVNGVNNLDVPTRMIGNPREVQIGKKAAGLAADFHGEVRTVCPHAGYV